MGKGDIARTCRVLAGLAFIAGAATPQATVKNESLPVYSKMDATSDVVKTLKKGDAVVIEMSILGEDNAEWCSIQEPTPKRHLGYVRCGYLERPRPPEPPSISAPTAPAAPGVQAAPADLWDPGHQTTLGEQRYLGWAAVIAADFSFSRQQKDRVLPIARQTGISACIEDTDSYVRKGLTPPDLLRTRSSPITQCDWNFQAFLEQVFALVTPQQRAAHRASYEQWRQQIAGGRGSLEQRSRGR